MINSFNLFHSKKNILYLIKLLKHHNEYTQGDAAKMLIRLCEEYKCNQNYKNLYDPVNDYIESNFKKIIKNINKYIKLNIKNVEKIGLYILSKNNNKLDILLVITLEVVNKILNRSKKRFFKKYIYNISKRKETFYLIAKFIDDKIELHDEILIEIY